MSRKAIITGRASGGMVAANCRELVLREVWSAQGGEYQVEVRTPDGVYKSYTTPLKPGLNKIRLASPDAAPLIRFANDALWDDEAQVFVLPRE